MKNPGISDNALAVLEKRYLKKNDEGKLIETPLEMLQRVARAIAKPDKLYGADEGRIERTYQKFLEMMVDLDFMPNSPTLMNAGRELGQLSACFVLPVDDAIESIFDAIKYTAMIHKSGGGTGFSFSKLRPNMDKVGSTGGVSSGPVSFMKVFDASTEAIKQGGTRRGANMGILRVDHPDIIQFIKCKGKDGQISNFNISVGITADFMRAVEQDQEYSLINPRNGEETDRLRARDVFDLIVEMAWLNGEPGIIFLDRLNADNPTPTLGEIESTNPCGEQPLLPYEACNLGSINLINFVENGKINWERLSKITRQATHFLDNVIDANRYPLPQITKMCQDNRKIGLGVMGWADMLFMLGIPYNSDEAVELADKLMGFILQEARKESRSLAETRGAFPNFGISTFANAGEAPLRNATITTIAPTGTISMVAGASSGIEPVFSLAYIRNIMDGKKFFEVDQIFKKKMEEMGLLTDDLLERITSSGNLHDIPEIPENIKDVYVCSHDIEPIWHIKMQAAFQKHIDNAVSKTVNFANSATRDDVREVYELAYKLGCKGVTIYRDGSRQEQVLQLKKKEEPKEAPTVAVSPSRKEPVAPRKRPTITIGSTYRVRTGCGNLFVTINSDKEGVCEVFATMGKSGGCAAAQSDGIARLISLALRAGVDTKEIIGQIRGLRCPAPSWGEKGTVLSCPDAIAQALEGHLRRISISSKPKTTDDEAGHDGLVVATDSNPSHESASSSDENVNIFGHNPQCPDCGSMLEFAEGCVICRACGYSKCG
ncbi:MAG TPA: vitamin B12-dependent ribonucleotide reductase [Caldisericia bacterium]|nr:vitamin B12-dependent ribonucleotide reductase [Caldisericia bacterium]HPF49410.1 vitamin B12-dependent ribonucleotide reductase [Caldisericia bacterium]HPI84387.1 vitamin B12-dependent ribonucleotide reductase [Caldisericia bacterium]HPQ93581.1 vitamin B12-dependent ribonucleotide reductase [Caldisericia bacterium]HRV75550.1 vitamin B12-dependent ribonucleotide reductase [Caldisericia bacterium]